MPLLKAFATIGSITMISRIAGFIRDILTAAMLGAGPIADAFFVALKLPNFFRRVSAEGAFTVAFVPVYSETLAREGADEARHFARQTMGMMLFILGGFTLLAWLFMPQVIMLIAPGFDRSGAAYHQAVDFARITLPYLFFMSLGALLGGLLNTHGRYAPFAAAPILFNLSLIGALLLLTPVLPNAGAALSWGVAGAGIVQLLFLGWQARRNNIPIWPELPALTHRIKKVFTLMGPGVIGAGVIHINLFADIIIASFLERGSIAWLYYADRLYQLPLGIVGIALGTALLPMLSRAVNENDMEKSGGLFNQAALYGLLFSLPAAFGFAAIAELIISVLFERGAFTAFDTEQAALALRAYALGIPAYVMVKVLSTASFARQDTLTPVKISVLATLVNIGLSLALIRSLGHGGIALATGLAAWLHVGSLYLRI